MNPYEQRLRDEVIYLHSLWHHGPPIHPPFNPNPQFLPNNPYPNFIAYPSRSNGDRQNYWKRQRFEYNPQPDSGVEWPCLKPLTESPPGHSAWPSLKPNSAPVTQPLSSEKLKELAAVKIQQKALDICCKFFEEVVDSDCDEEEDENESENENENENEESEEFKFFMKVFEEDGELRSYYEKNYEGGEFCCLVCGGIGKKVWKRFKDCVGLVQHSSRISKTKKKRAHRAFGHVVCMVLGWDICRLPLIVKKGEPLSQTLVQSGELQDEQGVANIDDSEVFKDNVETLIVNNGGSVWTEGSRVIQSHGDFVICENSLTGDVSQKHIENFRKRKADGDVNEDAVDCLGSDIEWRCEKPITESDTEMLRWPTLKPQSASMTPVFSAEELARISADQMQQKVSEACREFFAGNANSDSDEDNDEDEFEESEEYNFFLRVLKEENQLRTYYENNYEGGEFCCLVCGGIGKKVWRRFKGCIGLLQHSTNISKTKKKNAHRAYGQVICKVLGWDINKLPNIVLSGDPLSRSLEESSSQNSPKSDGIDNHRKPFDDKISDME